MVFMKYLYPFSEAPIPNEDPLPLKPKKFQPFHFEDALFDEGGSYAYNLQIDQQDLMKYAKNNDGSPVSFVSVMLYKALMDLYPETEKDIVFKVPHEYRKALGVEMFTLGEVFSLCFMQPGKNPAFVQQLMQTFENYGIGCDMMSEERFYLADYNLP